VALLAAELPNGNVSSRALIIADGVVGLTGGASGTQKGSENTKQSDGRCTKETGGSDSCCCRPRLRAGSVCASHGQFELGTRETAEEFW
jgi:hypothetical protein